MNNIDTSNISNEIRSKICPYCKISFYSHYNMCRHRDSIHLKKNLFECPTCHQQYRDMQTHIKTCGAKKAYVSKFEGEKLLANKRLLVENQERINDAIGNMKNKKRKFSSGNEIVFDVFAGVKDNGEITQKKQTEIYSITKNEDIYFPKMHNDHKNNIFTENNEISFSLNSKHIKINETINDIIISNLYQILNNNTYFSLYHYFILKNCVLGQGKYGTVWFGLDIKNGHPVAIKTQNNNKAASTLKLEITVMNKLKKFKIFSTLYDKFKLNDKIYLVETLHLPNIERFKDFCGGKFSISTVYEIGIELLNCFEAIHKMGHLYVDLKNDNIAILCSPIKIKKHSQKITLIDYGFCSQYTDNKGLHLEEINSSRLHGNAYFASLNSLLHNTISRRDDIISLCYLLADLYLGKLPWSNQNSKNLNKNEIIKLKQKCSPKELFGNDLQELLDIFNDANKLKFTENPNYNNYIKKLNKRINNEIKLNSQYNYYDWENKLINMSKKFDNINDFIENNEIVILFDGYPKFFIKYHLQKYFN